MRPPQKPVFKAADNREWELDHKIDHHATYHQKVDTRQLDA
jgi:hypothetical protein